MDCNDALVGAGKRVADADLGSSVGAELLDDVAAAADDAADLADGAEVAEDGVVGGDDGGGGGVVGGVTALVFGAGGVGIGVRVGTLAVGTALTGHRREWRVCECVVCCDVSCGYLQFGEKGDVRARVIDLFWSR